MTNYGFTNVSFVRNIACITFFSSRARKFLNWAAKAKAHHMEKFAPNLLYGNSEAKPTNNTNHSWHI